MPRRLEVATSLAARFGACLVGVHAKPPFESPGFMEGGYDVAPLLEAYDEGAEAERTAARAAYDTTEQLRPFAEALTSEG